MNAHNTCYVIMLVVKSQKHCKIQLRMSKYMFLLQNKGILSHITYKTDEITP